ncbi:hypothetical protein ACHAXT_008204 [Thalassiosira profunda]
MAASPSDDLLPAYALSAQYLTDGEPVRCVAAAPQNDGASLELLSGSQGGVVSRILLPSDATPPSNGGGENGGDNGGDEAMLDIQPGGANTRHPHQITALLSSSQCKTAAALPAIYATGCKDGNIRVMDAKSHELKFVLEGHSNAVTSLSWVEGEGSPWLVSGSWDGTARLWTITENSYHCLGVLEGHENTVSVAGLPAESDTVRRVVTVSAGVAEGNAIKGHTVRIWRLAPTPDGSAVKCELVGRVSDDHAGPMRDVAYDAETHSIYTCSNDGTVKIRSAADGTCATTLAYPGGDRPILLSVCVVGDWKAKAVVAGAEDGSVAIWDVSSNATNREAQVIAHPGCVWKVAPLPDSSDFVTACHDGHLRIFTRSASKTAPASVAEAFATAVRESQAARSTGPSADDIAQYPKWELNALHRGRSEGDVQVFNKDGKAIAAQWSAASGTWIEVGEVTGTNANAGTLNGQRYDHVLPIEIDVPGGGVQTLQIGYNNGENPFVTAQAFIDEHMLDQNYLAQIADYIQQRAGQSAPTLGMGAAGGGASGGGSAGYSAPAPAPMEVAPTYEYLPMKGYKTFDAGVDAKGLAKVAGKVREFNDASTANALSPNEAGDVLDALAATLAVTNRYHSSTVSDAELAAIHKMVTQWDAKRAFPALDLARMAVLHPDAASAKRRGYWEEVLRGALDACSGLADPAREVAVPMLTMRLVANSFKGGSGSARAAGSLMDRILECAEACAPSGNKNVRLSVATAVLNTSSYMHASSFASSSSAVRILDVVGSIVGCGMYEAEPIVRSLVALGTALLIPGGCGAEVQRIAKERGIGSTVERAASGHGDMAKAVAKEILLILS